MGTNTWAIRGNRTSTGAPILANDIHENMAMPSVWYEQGLHGDHFESVGFTLPGVPLNIIGHNQYIAWGFTSLHADIQDYYIEKLDDLDHPSQYKFMGKWYDLDVVHETINIKGSEPLEIDILKTRHGRITSVLHPFEGQPPMALRWTLYDGNQTFTSILKLNSAKGWDEFRTALQYWDMPAMSFVYADVNGNIGFQAAGKMPIRVPTHDNGAPVPGWTGEYEWQGYIPFNELPSILNPQQDFIVAANNKIVPGDYPYSLSFDYFPGFRARRITNRLTGDDSITMQDAQDIQGDIYSEFAKELLPYLLAIVPENTLQAQALAQVKAWDLYYKTDSVGASIYEVWYRFLLENTLTDELGEDIVERLVLRNNSIRSVPFLIGLMPIPDSHWFDDINTPEIETRDDMILRSLDDTVTWLSEHYGNDLQKWQWGQLHTLTLVHAPLGQSGIAPLERLFNSDKMEIGGSRYTVNGYFYWWETPFDVVMGPVTRMILDVDNWDNSVVINSTGQSEHLFHPHREDQIPLWRDMKYRPMLFTREAVEKNAEAVLLLTTQ
jgi:penicillin amidase